MKTVKLIAGIITYIAVCACGNTTPNTQNPSQAKENAVEAKVEQETTFQDLTLEEAFEKAKKEEKYVFISFYTKTCVPCKKMKTTVFSTSECNEYINKHFIPIMVDGEDDGIGTEIAKKYEVFIFPTYMILLPDGSKEGEILGAEYDVNKFLGMLKTIIHDNQ